MSRKEPQPPPNRRRSMAGHIGPPPPGMKKPDPPPAPPKADSDSQETHGCAALAITNRLLLEAVEFMQQNAKLLQKHRERIDEQRGRRGINERRVKDRLNAIQKRLAAIEKRLDSLDAEAASAFQQVADRPCALERGRQTKRAEEPADSPEPIGQAWIYLCDDCTPLLHTLSVGVVDDDTYAVCVTRADCLAHPNVRLPGQPVLVNLVPVYPAEEEGKS